MALSSSNFSQTSVNNPTPQSKNVSPRGFVLLNGQSVPWERFEVSNTRYAAAGTFRVTIPVSSLPKTMALPLLMKKSPLTVQINAGIPSQISANNATSSDVPMLISGDADEVVYEPHHTSIIISGRDYISRFLDNKIGQPNVSPTTETTFDFSSIYSQVSSSVISKLATLRGLTPVVTQTNTFIGKYYQNQNVLLNTQITEWDLITFLARQEGYDVFVLGNNLYFQPKSNSTPYQITIAVPYYTTSSSLPVSNVETISFTRNYRLAKDIVVNVSSFNIKDKMTYQAVATLNHTETVPEDTQIYNFTFANLSQMQCTQKAESLLLEISQHEMSVNIQMPADTVLTAHSVIAVKNTGTIFDQNYYVNNILREMDFKSGFTMTIEAKNQSPYSISVSNSAVS